VAPAAKVPAAMAAEMATAVKMPSASVATPAVTTSAVTTSTVAPAASRGCIAGSRQRGHKNEDGNADIEF
jgi:hypothetical protein